MKDIYKMPVHPLADAFPMLGEAELQELADDIKTHGQLHPVTTSKIDNKDTLIDGRNRLAACKLAGVGVEVEDIDESEVVAFIVSANLHRRNLSKSQIAIFQAIAKPEGKDPHPKSKGKKGPLPELGATIMSQARAIVREAPDLVPTVASGAQSVKEAYSILCGRRAAAALDGPRYELLKIEAPELVEKIDAEEMTVQEAFNLHEEIQAADIINRNALFSNLGRLIKFLPQLKNPDHIASMMRQVFEHPDQFKQYACLTPQAFKLLLKNSLESLTNFTETLSK